MGYLGNDLKVAYSTYKNIDDISGSFNGSTTSFSLLVGGVAPSPLPLNSQQCLISVGGVVQRPDDTGAEGFRLSGGNIVFSSAPGTGEDFFGVILAGADYVNVGANFPSGSAAVPSITFDSDLDTGIYNSAANQVSITTAGIERLRIDSAGQIESVSLGSVSAPAFSFTTDPNTGIYSPGADQVAISTSGAQRVTVDGSGRLLVGTSSARTDLMGVGAQFQLEGTSFTTSRFGATCNANNADGPGVYFAKSRGTSAGAVTIVNSGDVLGEIEFGGADGTNIDLAARIRGEVDGTPGANDMPGRLVFSTTADGASSPTERMRIANDGKIGFGTTTLTGKFNFDGSLYLFTQPSGAGNSTLKWNSSTGAVTYDTSSRLVKENIEDCPYGLAELTQLKPRKYFRTDDQKTEIGFIADEVVNVLPEFVPIAPKSVITHDPSDTDEIPVGVNYEKLTAVLTKALQEAIGEIESLKARVAALEAA